MSWKKILDTKELIAYEKSTKSYKARIEARYVKNRWRVYKTFNLSSGDDASSFMSEYIASSYDEAKDLLTDLQSERDYPILQFNDKSSFRMDMSRCYKEEFVEKWKLNIDGYSDDNFVVIRFDSEIKMDVVLHERYNMIEKQILEKLITSLGLKDICSAVKYDFFYYRKHSAKKRVYEKPGQKELVAHLQFNMDALNNDMQ